MNSTLVSFASFDGLMLNGTLVTPRSQIRGAMLLVHGITADREEWGFYTRMAQILEEIGIATLRFDYRCHGVDKTPMRELSLSGIVNDIDAAFQKMLELVGAYLPSFIFAHSFGGGTAAYWVSKNKNTFPLKVLFLSAPVIDYADDVSRNAGDWVTALRTDGYVSYGDNRLSRCLISEIPHINGIEATANPPCPLIVFHGDADTDVPLSSSQKFVKVSEFSRIEVIEGAEHGYIKPGDEDIVDPQTFANYEKVFSHLKQAILQNL